MPEFNTCRACQDRNSAREIILWHGGYDEATRAYVKRRWRKDSEEGAKTEKDINTFPPSVLEHIKMDGTSS
jgi:hypothetical protein